MARLECGRTQGWLSAGGSRPFPSPWTGMEALRRGGVTWLRRQVRIGSQASTVHTDAPTLRENGGGYGRDVGATSEKGSPGAAPRGLPGSGGKRRRWRLVPTPSRPPSATPGRAWPGPSVLAAACSGRQAGARPRSHSLRDAAGATAARGEASFAPLRGRGRDWPGAFCCLRE